MIVNWVKKTRDHHHRHSLQRDLQQNETYNLFNTMTNHMIQDVGNVELFELFETDPNTQCKECLSYWGEGIVCCTCGYVLKQTVADRSFIEYTLGLYFRKRNEEGKTSWPQVWENSRKIIFPTI